MRQGRLKIAVCHFHLHTGGVSRVIQHTLEALADSAVRVAVLSGEAPAQPLPRGVPFRVIPGLAYEEKRDSVSSVDLAALMRTAARDLLGDDPDVWHMHNHSLGKNLAFPDACLTLARKGHRLLLQIHDFAEDGRPALYRRLMQGPGQSDPAALSALLYPVAEHIHYAVLNGRDQRILAAAGVPDSRLHLLPNAVWLPRSVADDSTPLPYDARRRLWLYPTRAIRRKNLGEFLLWSALGEQDDLFGITQAPLNPAERPVYERWKRLAGELGLPVAFELGVDYAGDFLHLLQSAHALVSTSITEGFGLAFLEPWLVGCALAGRDLPEITGDFAGMGIDLGRLYQRLPVPLEWIGAEPLRERIAQGLNRSLSAYGRTALDRDGERAWNALVQNGQVDFGRLDEPLQERVLRKLVTEPQTRTALALPRLPFEPSAQRLAINRRIIDTHLSLPEYGRRLQRLYRDLADCAPSPLGAACGETVLDAFLAPERLHLLKT